MNKKNLTFEDMVEMFFKNPESEKAVNKFNDICNVKPETESELRNGIMDLLNDIKNFDPKKEFAIKADCVYLVHDTVMGNNHKVAFKPGDVVKPTYLKGELALVSNKTEDFVDYADPDYFAEINTTIAIDILQKIGEAVEKEPNCVVLVMKDGKVGYKPKNLEDVTENEFRFANIESAKKFYTENKSLVERELKDLQE